MEIYPVLIEGAVICKLKRTCEGGTKDCTPCEQLVVYLHNWLVSTKMPYAIFDLQEENEICQAFLGELVLLRKKLRIPLLFSGTLLKTQILLDRYQLLDPFPFWISPEDALHTMRQRYPLYGELAALETGVHVGCPLSQTWNISKNGVNPLFSP